MADDPLYPIAVLIEELKNEDVQIRLNSIQRLSTIALALGDARTRTELIPFLSEALDDEDEVLLAIAKELSGFIKLVGGAEYAYTLLPPLEQLAMVEESVVHDKAVEALCEIGAAMPVGHLEEHMMDMIQRLAADVGWASRVSACGLFTCVYSPKAKSAMAAAKVLYSKLCEDDMPMVRRAAAQALGKIAANNNAGVIKEDLFPVFQRLVTDEQDNVRPLAVKAATTFAKILSKEDNSGMLVGALQASAKDRSWRVRHVVAECFPEFQDAMGPELTRSELSPMLVRLMRDQEKEVRMSAVEQLPHVCKDIPAQDRLVVYTTNFCPYLNDLSQDTSQHVRVKLASVLVQIAPVLGKVKTTEILVPLFVRLLKDEIPEVRMSVVPSLGKLNEVVGAELVGQQIVPEIVALADDPQWRVRLAVCEQIPGLAATLGESVFNNKLKIICLTWLEDNVFAIRGAASRCLSELCKVLGAGWTSSSLIPKLSEMAEGAAQTYLSRLTALFLLQSCAKNMDKDVLNKSAVPIVLKLCKDTVPNVRFNASRTLETMAPKLDKGVVSKDIKPMLDTMCKDADVDVQFYSKQALAAL